MEYETVVFIDSNVALQCRELSQLPWFEIHRTGPILVLVTPTVLGEVDSKKNDGRLGNHARRFNNALRPLLSQAESVSVRTSPAPQVDIALAKCRPIQWSSYPDLDPSEPDSRIIAEALHTDTLASGQIVFISQDIRPLDLARRHGLKIHHVDENWLRPKEMTEAGKKAAALTRELDALKNKQPELLLEWNVPPLPVETVRVNDLLESDRQDTLAQILRTNPIPEQEPQTGYVFPRSHDYDHSLQKRYDKWSDRLLPDFMRQFESKLELMYNQIEVSLVLRNVGKIQAESLLLEITATGGWMNEKLILVSPIGPPAPTPRPFRHFDVNIPRIPAPSPSRGRHEVIVEEPPIRSDYIQVTCDDFRHGAEYKLTFIGWLDPRSPAPFELKAVATAANLHGEASERVSFHKNTDHVDAFELVDRETLKYRKQSLAQIRLIEAHGDGYDSSNFEFEE